MTNTLLAREYEPSEQTIRNWVKQEVGELGRDLGPARSSGPLGHRGTGRAEVREPSRRASSRLGSPLVRVHATASNFHPAPRSASSATGSLSGKSRRTG